MSTTIYIFVEKKFSRYPDVEVLLMSTTIYIFVEKKFLLVPFLSGAMAYFN